MKNSIHMEFKKNLMKELNKLDNSFDKIHRVLEQCLSKGVEESVESCVATTKNKILDVSVIFNVLQNESPFSCHFNTGIFFLWCHSE